MSSVPVNLTPVQIAVIDAIVSLFESNSPARYDAVARSASDAGGLSYGKHQAALVGGSLFRLISDYCAAPGALQAQALRPYLPRMEAGDRTLDTDDALVAILKTAAADPVMQDVQDRYFYEHYMTPALTEAASLGFQTALGCAILYDSFIQGSWSTGANIKAKTIAVAGAPTAETERTWLAAYLQTRRAWLASRGADLARSVYRIDALTALLTAGAWDLEMPLALPLSGYSFTLTAWDLNAHLFPDPVFRVDPEKFGTVKARHAIMPEGRDRHVQSLLSILGLLDPKSGVDGRFGMGSANVFKAFQLSCNAPQTGIVDPEGYLMLCDAVRRVEASAPAKGSDGAAVADLRPLPEPANSTRSRQYSLAAGASATAAGATVVGSNYFAPKDVTGDTAQIGPAASGPQGTPVPAPAAQSPAVQAPAVQASANQKSGNQTQGAQTQGTQTQGTMTATAPPAAPEPGKAPAVTASTATPPPAPDWDDTARELLPWVAVGLLIATLVFLILARRRAY